MMEVIRSLSEEVETLKRENSSQLKLEIETQGTLEAMNLEIQNLKNVFEEELRLMKEDIGLFISFK